MQYFSQLERSVAEYILKTRKTEWTSLCYVLHYP